MATRPLVAQTDPRWLVGAQCEPLAVGIVRWPDDRRVTIVVKATYEYREQEGEQRLTLCARQQPLTLATPSSLRGAGAGELGAPADFLTTKLFADVLLVGHAYGPRSMERIDARVELFDPEGARVWTRAFSTVGSSDDHMPLSRGFLRGADGRSAVDPVGPAGPWQVDVRALAQAQSDEAEDPAARAARIEREVTALVASQRRRSPTAEIVGLPELGDVEADEEAPRDWDDLDDGGVPVMLTGSHHAAPASRTDFIDEDSRLELVGLDIGGEPRTLRLPGHVPAVVYETASRNYRVDMLCDTLLIDTDTRRVLMVWRGQAPVDAAHIGPQRIVVSLESSDGWRSLPRIYRDLPRGRFARAVDEEALVTPGAAAVDVELELARLCSFSHTPEPSLTLEEYAAIAAELSLADDRKWRRDVLASKRLSEDDWSLEEQGWLLRMADATKQGDMSIGERYGRLLQQARAKQTSGGGA